MTNTNYGGPRRPWQGTTQSTASRGKLSYAAVGTLYGQEFLCDERFAGSLKWFGIILVEGITDHPQLHELNVLALATCSNRITDGRKRMATPACELCIMPT